jgi:acyl carrier protein
MEVKEKIRNVLVEILKIKPEELKDNIKLYDGIGVDSTEMVEILTALEKTFNIKLSSEEVNKNSTLDDIGKVVQSKLEQ